VNEAIRRLLKVGKWTVIVCLIYGVLAVPMFFLAAMIGDYTGWYRVEDYMCTIGPSCR
jgi:hypothetical protein